MTQVLAASLIAPDRPGLALGYRILTLAGANYSALTTDGIIEDSPHPETTGLTTGDVWNDGGTLKIIT